jgi:hypothetical protein
VLSWKRGVTGDTAKIRWCYEVFWLIWFVSRVFNVQGHILMPNLWRLVHIFGFQRDFFAPLDTALFLLILIRFH